MRNTFFYSDDGAISSIRSSSFGGTSFTNYSGSSLGGITIKTGNFTSRFNNDGACIGTSMKINNRTTYFSNSGIIDRLTPFK